MEVYLNDLSFYIDTDLMSDWDKIVKFKELLDDLRSIGVSIIAPSNVWSIPVGGYNLTTKEMSSGGKVPNEHHLFLQQIFKIFNSNATGEPVFSETKDMALSSPSVGKAVVEGSLVISLLLDAKYKVEEVTGWLKKVGCDPCSESVRNLYDKNERKNFIFLTDLSKCRTKDPVKDPMWNVEVSRRIIQDEKFIELPSDERMQKLIHFGRIIAEVNGWRYNKQISDLNTNREHKRFIFDSTSNFTGYRTAYISIDLEGPEVCYELCNNKGNHLGEISWDGKRKEAKSNHGIKAN